MAFSTTQISRACLQLFAESLTRLPPMISERLTCSRGARNHGSYRTVLLFNTWDRFQSDVLPKNHFCYCLGYDPNHLIGGGTDWYFHLWLNTIRVYRDRHAVKSSLETQLRQLSPRSFRFDVLDRAISIKINFNLKDGPEQLVDFLKPHYIRLIEAVHPVLIPIIDKYSAYGDRAEVKKEVATRGRIPHKPVRTARPDLVREYTRSIPPSWRKEILEKHDYKCAHCGEDLKITGHHIDHKRPFTRGGTSTKENLQLLCPPCNSTKGNRFTG